MCLSPGGRSTRAARPTAELSASLPACLPIPTHTTTCLPCAPHTTTHAAAWAGLRWRLTCTHAPTDLDSRRHLSTYGSPSTRRHRCCPLLLHSARRRLLFVYVDGIGISSVRRPITWTTGLQGEALLQHGVRRRSEEGSSSRRHFHFRAAILFNTKQHSDGRRRGA